MSKRVIDVGNCSLDHGSIRSLIEQNFEATIIQTHGLSDTLMEVKNGADLVIINRKMDRDGSDGMEIIRKLKEDKNSSDIPVMLLTNYPEFQQMAQAAGAVPGFGKNDFHSTGTVDKLRPFLGS